MIQRSRVRKHLGVVQETPEGAIISVLPGAQARRKLNATIPRSIYQHPRTTRVGHRVNLAKDAANLPPLRFRHLLPAVENGVDLSLFLVTPIEVGERVEARKESLLQGIRNLTKEGPGVVLHCAYPPDKQTQCVVIPGLDSAQEARNHSTFAAC